MAYLTGGDEVFGPNFGGATVYTNVRKGYVDRCPNVGKLLDEPRVHPAMENEVMGTILDDGEDPDEAAAAVARRRTPTRSTPGSTGVTTRDGGDALAAVRSRRSASDAKRRGAGGWSGSLAAQDPGRRLGRATAVDWLTDARRLVLRRPVGGRRRR